MSRHRVRIVNGLEALKNFLEEYRRLIYRYNALISPTGYYLKPIHIVVKDTAEGKRRYMYIGRYWWRISYAGKKANTSRVKWSYVGKEKPKELASYPDPPFHPLVGFKCIVDGNDILVDKATYKKYAWIFKGYQVVED